MNKTAVIYHEDYLKHDTGPYHPERKERLSSIMKLFKQSGILEEVTTLKPEKCSEEDILLVHTEKHLNHIKQLSERGGGQIDGDTYCGRETYEIARLAVGGEILAGKYVAEKKADNAFALVRPPGHHATRDKAMGFCYFNNVAIMIKYLQKNYDIKKVCIFDWDLHAANGTTEIFYEDPSVLVISIHQDPRVTYPGTGFTDEKGEGNGEGYTMNIPVPPQTGDADYLYLLENFILERIEKYAPDFMVISAGFDSHKGDPLGQLMLTEKGYSKMTESLQRLAENVCDGRLIVELEGGYNLDAVATSSYAVLKTLLGIQPEIQINGGASEAIKDLTYKLREEFNALW
ncbi:MAG: histone deacetylase [Candidatus Altiarchaeota archaeon]|nr:histone deacetylase [Candidatus Altiarchaeota archaeon]